MTIYHFAVLALLLLPLLAWGYRASASSKEPRAQSVDLSTPTLALRAVALFLGFIALYSLTSANLVQASVQAILWMLIGATLFGVLTMVLLVFRRRFVAPKRKLVELWLFILVLSVVLVLINVQVERIKNGQ